VACTGTHVDPAVPRGRPHRPDLAICPTWDTTTQSDLGARPPQQPSHRAPIPPQTDRDPLWARVPPSLRRVNDAQRKSKTRDVTVVPGSPARICASGLARRRRLQGAGSKVAGCLPGRRPRSLLRGRAAAAASTLPAPGDADRIARPRRPPWVDDLHAPTARPAAVAATPDSAIGIHGTGASPHAA
jgi:hypothetical protein